MTAERITTTEAPGAASVAEPEIAPTAATAPSTVPPPLPSDSDTDTDPTAAEKDRDREKSSRRKADSSSATPPRGAFGGLAPPLPATSEDRGGGAADTELDGSHAVLAAPLADSDTAAAPTARGLAQPDAAEATTATRRPSQSTPAETPQTRPAQSATAAPAAQTSPSTGGVGTPSPPFSIPPLPISPLPSLSQPDTATPTEATASSDPSTGALFTDGLATSTTSPIFNQLQQILDTLIVLESMLGSGGMQMPGFTALETALEPSMGAGAAAAAEYDLATFQQNEGNAFNSLDNGLLDALYSLAGDNAAYQADMRTIVANTDAQLAMLGPYAYTSAGHQQAAAILDNALASALQICQSSRAQSVVASALIDNLTQQYLTTVAAPMYGSGAGSSAASIASQYLGWYEPQLQAEGVDGSSPYGEACANFVSSMLEKAGLINWHTNLVASLASQLPAQGWTQVSLANAKPGDVWICNGADGESHTEIVASNNNGHVTLIGSNNVSSDMQQISYDGYSATIPGSYILAPP